MRKQAKKILVIDDDLGMIRLLEKWLPVSNKVVIASSTALLGLQKARDEQPDCILLDVRLPDLNGIEVARQLRADPVTRDIPVIFITVGINVAKDKGKEIIEVDGIKYRAFAKPLHNPKLISEIRRHINRRENKFCRIKEGL